MTICFKSSKIIKVVNCRKADFNKCRECYKELGDCRCIGIFSYSDGTPVLQYLFHFTCFKKNLIEPQTRVLSNISVSKDEIYKELINRFSSELVLESL